VKRRYSQFNSKRKLKDLADVDLAECSELAKQIRYGGNPMPSSDPLAREILKQWNAK